MSAPIAIVVMGVSGCGKTTVASRLAQRLGWDFAEADAFHSPANILKMRSGVPLTDDDRWPWLDAIARRIAEARAARRPCVLTCSALKRSYRARLRDGHDDVSFVYLKGTYERVASRLAGRVGHYMPASLLRSQFDALEEPAPDENAVVLSIAHPVDQLVDELVLLLRC
jgi:gluconokinase